MIHIKNYLYDGASWQAQAVLAFLREYEITVTNDTWNGNEYDVEIKAGRYENGREQGYVFNIVVPFSVSKDGETHSMNWAVYEHRSGDTLCVISREILTVNTPTWEIMGQRDKYNHDKEFKHGQITECGFYLMAEMKKYLSKYYGGRA